MAVSCTDESIVEQSGNELRITGSVASDSRTTFVEGEGVIETHWNVDDEITLYTGDEDNQLFNNLIYKAVTGGKNTEFKLGGTIEIPNEEGRTIYACYPHNSGYEGYKMTHSIPSNYWLFGSTLGSPFLYGQSEISNNQLNFSFKHYFSYLGIKISVQDIKELFADLLKQVWAGNESDYDLTKTYLTIRSSEDIALQQGNFNPKTHETTSKITNKYLRLNLDDIDFSSDNSYTYMVPILPLSAGSSVSLEIYFVRSAGNVSGITFEKTVPEGGFKVGHVYNWNIANKITNEKLTELLKILYEKTGGSNWQFRINWLSDKPVEEWEGIYLAPNGLFSFIWLRANNLTGPFPEVLADIMDCSNGYFNLSENYLHGYIPDKVKNHKRWKDWGWYVIAQRPYEPIIQDYNLYPKNVQVEDLFEDESVVKDLYEIFKNNKLTQVIKGYDESYKPNIGYLKNEFGANRVNLHLDYQSKGLGTLIFTDVETDEEVQMFKKEISTIYGNIDGVRWLKGNSPVIDHIKSGSYFFDSNGQLVYYAHYDYESDDYLEIKNNNLMAHSNCIKALAELLGEPAEHPEFKYEIYTSTDYTKDGEVLRLQKADVGKGINLIFMGEGFVDKDMETGGYYEQKMTDAMNEFFEVEPYKTMRNRFNVYTVKVVSPNAEFIDGAVHGLNDSYTACFDYARNVMKETGDDSQPMMITVIYNLETGIIKKNECQRWEDGSFIGWNRSFKGAIAHESGGHGFGGLNDEYIVYVMKHRKIIKT